MGSEIENPRLNVRYATFARRIMTFTRIWLFDTHDDDEATCAAFMDGISGELKQLMVQHDVLPALVDLIALL